MFKVKDTSGNTKYAGRSKAMVIDNRDPLNKGRIIVDHPQLGKTVWIDYLRSPGQFSVPSIRDIVYIECDVGEYAHPFAWGNLTKGLDESPELPAAFMRDIPTNRGLYTPGGHLFELDDGEATITSNPDDTQWTTNKRGVRVTTRAGNKIHIAEDTDAGNQYLLIQDINGNLFKLDYKLNKLTINSVGTSEFKTTGNRTETTGGNLSETTTGNHSETVQGNVTENITGNQNQTIGGNLQVDVTGNVVINCAQATVTASGNATIDAGGSATVKAGGAATVDAGGNIILKSTANTINGGLVTNNAANNDPITGIPLTPVGGIISS